MADANWEQELRDVPYQKPEPSTWPEGVRQIGIGEISALGVDSKGRLYWHGQLVEIRNRIKLTYWQSVGAIVVSFFVIIGGLGSAAQGTAVFHDCKMQLWSFACPRSAPANPVNIEPKSGARN
ncbi:MAG: hypothetical protein WB822_20860 [Rhodoplanes sp.]